MAAPKKYPDELADSSVASVMPLFGLLMREAVADRRIPHNPHQGIRMVRQRAAERSYATAGQVNQIAGRIARPSDQPLVITAAVRHGDFTDSSTCGGRSRRSLLSRGTMAGRRAAMWKGGRAEGRSRLSDVCAAVQGSPID